MKKLSIIFLSVLISSCAYAQKRNLKLSLSSGIYTSTNYPNVKSGPGYAFDMSYYITDKIFLASHVNYGGFRYYDDVLSNSPQTFLRLDGTNSFAKSIHVGFQIGYNFKFSNLVDLYGSTGVSSYTLMRTYPFQSDENTWVPIESAWTDMAFPVRLGIEFHPWEKISFGIVTGFYIEPDFPIVGFHFGPILSYIF